MWFFTPNGLEKVTDTKKQAAKWLANYVIQQGALRRD